MAAVLATRANTPELAHLLEAPGPSKLPPEPFAWFGANMYMRWKEKRAGREL